MSQPFRRITRRTMLRGLGVAMGLPWLEAMQPAAARAIEGGGAWRPPVRMACLFVPNGVNPHAWTPEGIGRDFELSPILAPLAEHKDDLLVLTNLMNRATDTGDGHYVKTAGWLTGTTITRTTGSDLDSGGVSIDQLAASRIGHMTPLPSLELGVDPVTRGVDTNVGYTRLYGSHISWSTPTTPLAKEINPKLAFDRLFRSQAAESSGNIEDDRSVLDLVMEDARALRSRVGHADRLKIDEYLDSVRAVETRIAFDAEGRRARYLDDPDARRDIEALGGRIDTYVHDAGHLQERELDHTEHVRLMLDLLVLAFQTDSTRIGTFMFGNAVSGKDFSFLDGVRGGFHQLSHHENDDEKLEQYKRINAWHSAQLSYMLGRMRQVREGDGTLLDNAMVLFGSGLRDGNRHDPHNLPILLAGRGGGTLATGRHLRFGKDTPLCNLFVSMLDRVGTPVERFADSTGPLPGLDNPDFVPVVSG
ncbi:DUF1552 domain-containing protein [Tautonia sociabilis]|uniref:DUF1552 domain-containing protein n=1 Tax=Tautonia sociabilis TaxID=2080755 RepID=A0A432MLL7_9BACT|nr:DUF1552 domain-containing protein [Tautonia sociabilis]RUL88314.1 DUF1552 domain-containing protein [Tautonia sociabilis]